MLALLLVLLTTGILNDQQGLTSCCDNNMGLVSLILLEILDLEMLDLEMLDLEMMDWIEIMDLEMEFGNC